MYGQKDIRIVNQLPVLNWLEVVEQGMEWIVCPDDANAWKAYLETGCNGKEFNGIYDALYILYTRHITDDDRQTICPNWSREQINEAREKLYSTALETNRANSSWKKFSLFSMITCLVDGPDKITGQYYIKDYFLHDLGEDWLEVYNNYCSFLDKEMLSLLFFLRPERIADGKSTKGIKS